MGRREYRPHLRNVRLDRVTQSESICGSEIDLADDKVAGSVGVDPFDGFVGVSSCARCGPPELGDHLREVREFGRIVIDNENLHLVWLLR